MSLDTTKGERSEPSEANRATEHLRCANQTEKSPCAAPRSDLNAEARSPLENEPQPRVSKVNRATKQEFEVLKILAHCAMEFKENSACLERLEEACDRQGGLSELAAQAQSLVQAFSLTLPDHQRRQLFRHVCDMKLTYTSPVASTKDERYEYVPRETILNLITSGAQDKCTLCLTEPTEVAACTFRRAVNELRMDAVPDDLLGCTVRLLASPK